MRILKTCGSLSWGGLEMFTLQISSELKRRGHDVRILCAKGSTLGTEARKKGIDTYELLQNDRMILKAIANVRSFLKYEPFDIVHTHLSHDLWTLVPAIEFAKVPAKLFLTKEMASGVRKTDIFHRYLYSKLSAVFAISGYIRRSVLNTCPVPTDAVHIIPPGIEVDRFDPSRFNRKKIRQEFGFSEDVIIVGMAGRLTPGKGHEEFLRAAKRINEKKSGGVLFAIAGSASYGESDYEEKIRKLSIRLGLEKAVRFVGFQKNIEKFLSALDIFAFPSHEESFGLALVEAMSMKLPVIASGSAGVLDIVTDGETGILFPPKDYEALASGIMLLIENDGLRKKLGESA
ncbi:MAG: glycosyltransferase family 4 protein, partial [Candidatus Kryptoniota bacterium]